MVSTSPRGGNAAFPTPTRLVDVGRLLDLPIPEGPCIKPGKPAHLRLISNPAREHVVRYACKSWWCSTCRARLRRDAGEHFATLIMQSDGVLRMVESEPYNWDTHKRRMRRNGTQWVRIGELDKPGVVITCSKPPKKGYVFSGREEAVRFLGDELRHLTPKWSGSAKRFQPINASAAWRPDKKPKKFSRVGWVSTNDPLDVKDKLASVGIDPSTIRTLPGNGNKIWDCVFDCPPEMKDVVASLLGS